MDKILDKIIESDIKLLFSEESKRRGVKNYAELLQEFPLTNVEKDFAFQKKFNGFYRVRRNGDWQKVYYSIMEKGKTSSISFESVLHDIYKQLGRVEFSFASKLIHTLNQDMPILDRFVLQNLGIEQVKPYWTAEKKLQHAVCVYNEVFDWYKQALSNEKLAKKIVEFDEFFPEYKWFSQTKKLDFFLWQIRD